MLPLYHTAPSSLRHIKGGFQKRHSLKPQEAMPLEHEKGQKIRRGDPDRPLTPKQVSSAQYQAYREKGWLLSKYKFPASAVLNLQSQSGTITTISIGRRCYFGTVTMQRRQLKYYPNTVAAYVTIKSKANT